MSNKEILKSYNTKLNKNNTSLDSVLESINKLSTVSGTLEITENGEHDVKNYERAVVNIGESAESIKSLDELKTAMINQIINFNAYLLNEHSNTYEKYTTEPVTLYTPSAAHKHYVIRCRGASSYSIIWFKPIYLKYGNSSTLNTAGITLPAMNVFANNQINETTGGWDSFSSSEKGYMSSNYSSIDACIEAMKNPNTTYSSSSPGANWNISDYRDYGGKHIIPCTNLPYFNEATLEQMQRISSDETILVIGE